MKKIVVLAVCAILGTAVLVHAQEELEEPAGFVFVLGPRLGVTWTIMSPEDFSQALRTALPWFTGNYFPVNSLFGVSIEQRILLGNTKSHFAFQEVISIAGLEQSILIPSLSVLIGYRDYSGFELGAGPRLSLSGVGVIVAIGWTFKYQGVNVPVDLHYVLPNGSGMSMGTLGLTTGFNFTRRKEQK